MHNGSVAVKVVSSEPHCPGLFHSGGVPSRGNYLAQHRLHRQCWLHSSHQQEAHRSALLAGWREQVRRRVNWVFCVIKDDYLSYVLFFKPLRLSFPHATDETLLAKFKQQHQGNKYFVPTPVMEPAFVIQHFAGRVKYQVKVRMLTKGCFYFICALIVGITHYLIFLLYYNSTGLSGKEHGPHAFRHYSVVEE